MKREERKVWDMLTMRMRKLRKSVERGGIENTVRKGGGKGGADSPLASSDMTTS